MVPELTFTTWVENLWFSQGGDCGQNVIETVLLIYPMYTTTEVMVNFLKQRTGSSDTAMQTAEILKEWIKIEKHRQITETAIENLPQHLTTEEMNKLKLQILNAHKPTDRTMRLPVTLRNSHQRVENRNTVFIGYQLKKCAQALTMIDWGLFEKIKPKHILQRGWQGKDRYKNAKPLAKLADRFVEMSCWVATQILTEKTIDSQVQVLATFIRVMKRLVDMRNYETSLQILGGLNMAAIQRMKHLWAQIPYKRKVEFNEIDELFSPVGNYAKYRQLIQKQEAEDIPCLPYIAIFLRDVTYIFDGNDELLEDGSLNYERWQLLAQQVKRLKKLQQNPYNHDIPSGLTKFLTKLWPIMSEDELYEISLEQRPIASEPRDDMEEESALTLQEILKEPLLQNGFRKFLTEHNCAEYLHFIRDVDKLMDIPTNEEDRIESSIARIILLYFAPQRKLSIDLIDSLMAESLCSQFTNGEATQTMFHSIREEIYKYLQNEKLQEFLCDPLFRSSRSVLRSLGRHNSKDKNLPIKEEEQQILGNRSGLTEEDWDVIFRESVSLRIKAGDILCKQGEIQTCIYRVESGALVARKRYGSGIIKRMKSYTKGSIIGEMNIFFPAASSVAISATKLTLIKKLDVTVIKKYFLIQHDKALLYYQNVGARLAESLAKKSHCQQRVEVNVRRDGQKLVKSSDATKKKTVKGLFDLPTTEEVLGEYKCKVIFNAVATRSGTLYITSNYICYESKLFGQRTKEIFLVSRIRSHQIDVAKKQVSFKIRNRKKRFSMSADDLADCSSKLELLKKNIKRRASSQRNCKMRSLSMDDDEMELSVEDWDEIISSNTSVVTYQPGDVIIEQGQEYSMTWQINSGSVRVEMADTSGFSGFAKPNAILANLGVGELFGEISFLAGIPASASVIAEEELEAFVTTKGMLENMYSSQRLVVVKFFHYLCTLLTKRIQELERSSKLRRSETVSSGIRISSV